MTEGCNNKGLIETLLPITDAILGVRDSIGAVIRPVYFVTRTWYKDQNHTIQSNDKSGFAQDVTAQMLPSPQIVDLTQEIRAREGGVVKNGDIMLKSVSRNSFNESQLDGSSSSKSVEKLFMVGVKMYQVVKVTEKYVTWNVVLKELTNQTRY